MIRARAASIVVLFLIGWAAACGIPADDGPRAIPQEQVPADLDGDFDVSDDAQTLLADLYFTRFNGERDNLVTIEREVPTGGSSSTPTPRTVLEALLAGVQDDDQDAADIGNKIPAGTGLANPPELVDGVLTVDLTAAISNAQGDGALLAYGQMVCTAGALDEVESVLFTVEGEPVRPLTGEGEISRTPLTCDSYANLLDGPQT